MIDISDVPKRYGHTVAVDNLSFEVRPGEVTGFLGPNGAGKSTTTRMVVGLDAPTSGRSPSTATPPGTFASRSATWAPSSRPGPSTRAAVPGTTSAGWQTPTDRPRRVDEVLELVGLAEVNPRRSGGFSLPRRHQPRPVDGALPHRRAQRERHEFSFPVTGEEGQ